MLLKNQDYVSDQSSKLFKQVPSLANKVWSLKICFLQNFFNVSNQILQRRFWYKCSNKLFSYINFKTSEGIASLMTSVLAGYSIYQPAKLEPTDPVSPQKCRELVFLVNRRLMVSSIQTITI